MSPEIHWEAAMASPKDLKSGESTVLQEYATASIRIIRPLLKECYLFSWGKPAEAPKRGQRGHRVGQG